MSSIYANQAQLCAITHVSGPMLVIAGPGSGKTFVITERIRYLIEEARIEPNEILVITFSNAAAKEMKERFQKRIGNCFCPVNFGTFHAVFYHILQHTNQYGSQSILRDEEKFHYLREIIEEHHYQITNENEWIREMLAYISCRKLKQENCDTGEDSILRDVFDSYCKKCRLNHKLDFDDMMTDCLNLFRDRKDILKEWQLRYQYILIDEFQDISPIQYEIVRLLAGDSHNLFVVGDDDQSIYGFRGAGPELMRKLEQDYSETKRVVLNENYRSTEQILKAAERMISHNSVRYVKHMKAAADHTASKSVLIKTFEDRQKEFMSLTETIRELHGRYAYESMAVLCRTGYGSSGVADHLMKESIPFFMREKLSDFYQHFIAQDIIAYLELIVGNRKRQNFYRIMNKPKRYISRAAVDDTDFDFGRLIEYYRDRTYVTEAILKLQYDIHFLEHMSPYGIVQYIGKGIGYEQYLVQYAIDHNHEPEVYLSVFEELKERARGFATASQWLEHINAFERQMKRKQTEAQKGVMLSTIHASKGLEYDIVWIMDLFEGNIPHQKAKLKEELEEERRILYVAMTRAREHLFLYYPRKFLTREVTKSRFLCEIDRPLPVLYNKIRK